jgi:hypothetical protein
MKQSQEIFQFYLTTLPRPRIKILDNFLEKQQGLQLKDISIKFCINDIVGGQKVYPHV